MILPQSGSPLLSPFPFSDRKGKLHDHALRLLEDWLRYAERDWTFLPGLPGEPAVGFYGTGFNGWGVQTQQKYVATAAAVAHFTSDEALRRLAIDRAMAALRWNLAAHRSGPGSCTDGTRWGHTWISVLGIERMMFGVELLKPHFADADHEALRRVLCSEAEWLLCDYHRGRQTGIHGDVWGHSGKNSPESNIWNGAFLWRVASLFPGHSHAADWRERAHEFLLNGVSVAADAQDASIVAGLPVKELHRGANFFPHYALDHHSYFNVGYMIICVSNVGMLHFDLKKAGVAAPETLHHHQAELWSVARELIFEDGRLARIGGDTRIRYAYCQDYLLPALLYAADHLGDAAALGKLEALLEIFAGEARYCGDGSFFSKRLAELRRSNPHYHTRLESDRASVLAMLLAYGEATEFPVESRIGEKPQAAFDWAEPEYGAAVVKSSRRFASFAWRAYGLAQGMCLPPDDGHLAEWQWNLAGKVEFLHHPRQPAKRPEPCRRLDGYALTSFPGGFLTSGRLMEGVDLALMEGWSGTDSAVHHLVFVALPDDATVIGLQFCRTTSDRHTLLRQVKGLHLNLPNDFYNAFTRRLETENGEVTLDAPAPEEQTLSLGSRWASVEGRLGIVGIYGADALSVHREPQRRGGMHQTLYVEEICFPAQVNPRLVAPGEVVLDAGWAVLAGADSAQTRAFAGRATPVSQEILGNDALRAVRVIGCDGREYTLVANFAAHGVSLPEALTKSAGERLASAAEVVEASEEMLAAGEARLYGRASRTE